MYIGVYSRQHAAAHHCFHLPPKQGGYTTGRQEIIDVLRQKARPYLFSNTIAPPVVGASLKVFDMLMASTEARDTLERNTLHFRKRMTEVCVCLGGCGWCILSCHPVSFGDCASSIITWQTLTFFPTTAIPGRV